MQLTDEQQYALDVIGSWVKGVLFEDTNFFSLTGEAGCGKTYLTSQLFKMFPYAIFTALTAKAAQRLRELSGAPTATLHSTLYLPPTVYSATNIEFINLREPISKLLIVDEASMLTPKLWQDLHYWADKGVKILFVGDIFQLPPVISEMEAKKFGPNFSIFKFVKGVKLTKIIRNDDEIINICSLIRNNGTICKKNNEAYTFKLSKNSIDDAIEGYLADRDDHMLITWKNKARMNANHKLRKKLGIVGILPDKEEKILICKNGQGYLNGDVVETKSLSPGPTLNGMITYWLTTMDGKKILVSTEGKEEMMDGFLPQLKNWKEYLKQKKKYDVPDPLPITYGLIFTCHKLQGSQARKITVFLDKADLNNYNFNAPTVLDDDRVVSFSVRWLYTSFSRAQKQLTFILGE